MNATPGIVVSIEKTYADWESIAEALEESHEAGPAMAAELRAQATPSGLGAVVRALPRNLGPDVSPVILVLCSDGDSVADKLAWRDPHEGGWYERGEFTITEVLSLGIPWPSM